MALRPRVLVLLLAGGCGFRAAVPPFHADDARFGRLGGSGEAPDARALCTRWAGTVATRDETALSHVSFPEANVQDACFTPVVHAGRSARPGVTPRGCAYPGPGARARALALADALELGDASTRRLFPCTLAADPRAAAVRQDVGALRALARRTDAHPYAAAVVAGHGLAEQDKTPVLGWSPGDACRPLSTAERARLGVMPARAARAADAIRGDVAPLAIVTGGAVHSRLVEAFALMFLLVCDEGIDPARVLVEPCAEHTHTNLRNSGRWIHAMHGRAAYLLTDDHVQSDYFQDFSGFDMIMGNIDQRSLRDWGYVIGSWRQASIGIDAGFWFTPYRFWAEPRDGLGAVTCVDGPE